MLINNKANFTIFTRNLGKFIEKVQNMPKIDDFTVNQVGKDAYDITFTCYIQPYQMDQALNEACAETGTSLVTPPLFTATYRKWLKEE